MILEKWHMIAEYSAQRMLDWIQAVEPYDYYSMYDTPEDAMKDIITDFEYRDRLQSDIDYLTGYIIEDPDGEMADDAYQLINDIELWMDEN